MTNTGLPAHWVSGAVVSSDVERRKAGSVEAFETYRSYLFSIAYRMLGSVMDAEDMVQETYLRYQGVSPATINSLKAYLTTILTRLCIDQLHLAYKQRETYLGPWLPEPIMTGTGGSRSVEQEGPEMRESLSLAFLVMLERLQPIERAVFLLREVFDYDYADIAVFVGKSETACRQSFSRAKKRLADQQPHRTSSPETHRQLLASFLQVVRAGDTSALIDVLAEDVTLWADGGGKAPGAAIYPVIGRAEVAQFSVGASRRFLTAGYRVELSEVNHQPAAIVREGERAVVVFTIETDAKRVKVIRLIANPDKLAHL